MTCAFYVAQAAYKLRYIIKIEETLLALTLREHIVQVTIQYIVQT